MPPRARTVALLPRVVPLDGRCTLGREDLGGKAWGINRMRALGLPVPPAFTVTTLACREYYANGRVVDAALWDAIVAALPALEEGTGRRFGGPHRPLLVSVRSGGARSMPGMMDTVLDLGINDAVEAALAREGDAPFATAVRAAFVAQFRAVVQGGGNAPVPDDPLEQLRAAVAAVFASWQSERARVYRANRGLPEDGGTAVTVQAMVFGNLDERSGTGVLFSRDPITGEAHAFGEWLPRAQGESVVAGLRTPRRLEALREQLPRVHAQLLESAAVLERDARDAQDIEYTVESGRLWLLQTRAAKRSPQAALRMAVAMAREGLIDRQEAVRRVDPALVDELPRLRLLPEAARRRPAARGEPGCPGLAMGLVVTDPAEAAARAARGEDVILARVSTSPNDLQGVIAARALVTEQGGSTSHAAVVSRELGRPCVVGCGAGTVTALAGRCVTVDGAAGCVWSGALAMPDAAAEGDDLATLRAWGLRTHCAEEPPPGGVARGAGVPRGTGEASPAGPVSAGADELTLLRLLALKGRPGLAVLADSLHAGDEDAARALGPLRAAGLCSVDPSACRLTAAGRARMEALLAAERRALDPLAMEAAYRDFVPADRAIKRILTDWQVGPDGLPADRADRARDDVLLARLQALHAEVAPLLRRLGALVPRLRLLEERLARTVSRALARQPGAMTGIVADSVHTVWFELHEELIALAGLTRQVIEADRP